MWRFVGILYLGYSDIFRDDRPSADKGNKRVPKPEIYFASNVGKRFADGEVVLEALLDSGVIDFNEVARLFACLSQEPSGVVDRTVDQAFGCFGAHVRLVPLDVFLHLFVCRPVDLIVTQVRPKDLLGFPPARKKSQLFAKSRYVRA